MAEVTPERQAARLYEYAKGFMAVHLIDTGLRLGLFARLREAREGLTPADLARALSLHEPYVRVWCETAYAWELLDATAGGGFRLAPHYDAILADAAHPRYLGALMAGLAEPLTADLRRYPEYFRTGGVYPFQAHGQAFSRCVSEISAGFHAALVQRILPAVPGIQSKLEAGAKVLDVGCGAGDLLIKLAQAYPRVEGLGVDIDPHGIGLARWNIAEAGLGHRLQVEPLGADGIGHADEFDLAILFEVLHEMKPAVRPDALAGCYRALKPGGTLFILDETYPSRVDDLRKPEYAFAVQTAFSELVWGNTVPTREEQDALLAGAGFTGVQRFPIAAIFTAITAQKPRGGHHGESA